jgi:hypothetical protein
MNPVVGKVTITNPLTPPTCALCNELVNGPQNSGQELVDSDPRNSHEGDRNNLASTRSDGNSLEGGGPEGDEGDQRVQEREGREQQERREQESEEQEGRERERREREEREREREEQERSEQERREQEREEQERRDKERERRALNPTGTVTEVGGDRVDAFAPGASNQALQDHSSNSFREGSTSYTDLVEAFQRGTTGELNELLYISSSCVRLSATHYYLH